MSKKTVSSLLVVLLMVALPFASAVGGDEEGDVGDGPADIPSNRAEVIYTKPSDFNDLVSWFQDLEQTYPNYMKVWKANEDYGHGQILNTSGGADYDYWMVRLTNESTGMHKPEVLILGSPHGDENQGTIGNFWFADWILRHALTEDYNTTEDDWLNWLLDNREIYFAVAHNPDGFTRVRRFDGNNYDLNRQGDYDHVPNSGMYNTGPEPFYTPNGKTLVSFINDHQIRIGADHHSGVRMILYPWASSHSTITETSKKSNKLYNYAPPDFHYFDISSLRVGSFIGSTFGTLDKDNIGTIPDTVGYSVPGGIAPWAYGGDVINATAEDSHVQDEVYGNYQGAGILWTSPEWGSPKTASDANFGGDLTPGYGPEVRRFLLHQTDLAQPYLWITKDSIANNSVVNVGEDMQFLWKVNGCLVVDDTYIQYGMDPDPENNYENETPHRDMFKDEHFGGSGWENAAGGTHVGYVHGQTIKAPDKIGDYYFIIRAMVDQAHANVTGKAEYGDDPYLRLVKERTNLSYSETLNGADGIETMTGQLWWYSDVVHIQVVKKPEILNHTPEVDSQWVPTDVNITFEFDLDMDPAPTEAAFGTDPPVTGTFVFDGPNVTFDPDTDLLGETTYTVTLNSSARSMLNTTLGDDYVFSFTTAFSSDITPPSIINTTPTDGAQEVSITTDIRVFFSEDMNTTATEAAFSLIPVTAGGITWENGSSTLVFTPDEFLDGPIDHVFSISTLAMDLGRNQLPQLESFGFRTEVPDKVLPEVVNTTPIDGETMVPLESNITIEFSEPMFYYYTEAAFNISPKIDGNLSWDDDHIFLTFDPGPELETEMEYTVTIHRNATDMYFNRLKEDYVFTFTAEDITPPTILSTSPVDGATDIWVETDIIVNFSEPMLMSSLVTAFSIQPHVDVNIFITGPDVAFSSDGRLDWATTYNVTISTAATDLNGLTMEQEYKFSFITVEEPDMILPKVILTDPTRDATNVSVYGAMTIRFSEPIYVPPGVKEVSINPGPNLAYDIKVEVDTINVIPRSPSAPWLADRTTYTVKVTGSIEDLSQNPMGGDYIFSFETGYTGPPQVIGIEPADKSTDNSLKTTIAIHFSRAMDWTCVEEAFVLQPNAKGTFATNGSTMVFTPTKALKDNTFYTVKITTKAKDQRGNGLEKAFTSSFKTEHVKTTDPVGGGIGDMFSLLLVVIVVIVVVAAVVGIVAYRKKQRAAGEPPPAEAPEPGPEPYSEPEPAPAPIYDTGPPQEPETPPEPEPVPEPEPAPEPAPEPVQEEPSPEPRPEPEPGPQAEAEPEPGTDPTSDLDNLMKELDDL